MYADIIDQDRVQAWYWVKSNTDKDIGAHAVYGAWIMEMNFHQSPEIVANYLRK